MAASMNYSLNIWTLDGSDPTKCHVDEHPTLITVLAFPKRTSHNDDSEGNVDYLLIGRVDGSVALISVSTNSSFPMVEVLPPHPTSKQLKKNVWQMYIRRSALTFFQFKVE